MLKYQLDDTFVHQDSERHTMQASERLSQLFIIPRQMATARCPGAANSAPAIADLAQEVRPLRGLCGQQGQIGGDQLPASSLPSLGVGFAFHTASLASSIRKCLTRSR